VWAAALRSSSASLPAIGDLVLISFEHGDTDYPIWDLYSDASHNDAASGYLGKYRASVVDNADPMQENRLEVIVPDVDTSPIWATATDDVRYNETPEIGTEVWIEYEYGDPAYPRWVGSA
jgi:Type VI secretion system/phage-baseplate injector OB domain